MKIALGCDHGGFEMKEYIKTVLERLGHTWEAVSYTHLDVYKRQVWGSA